MAVFFFVQHFTWESLLVFVSLQFTLMPLAVWQFLFYVCTVGHNNRLYSLLNLFFPPLGGLVEVREVVRTGVLSYLLVSLSSRETDVRRAAAHCLSLFSSHLRSSSSREKPQVS